MEKRKTENEGKKRLQRTKKSSQIRSLKKNASDANVRYTPSVMRKGRRQTASGKRKKEREKERKMEARKQELL